jgi:L-serine dehydratase
VPDTTVLPYAFRARGQLLALCKRERTSIAEIMRCNERHWRSDPEIDAGLLQTWRGDAGLC